MLADAAALHGRARAMEGAVAGHVRVGTLSDPGFIRLADFLSEATDRFPLIEIELRHEVSGAAFEKVRDGALDASFYLRGSHPSGGRRGRAPRNRLPCRRARRPGATSPARRLAGSRALPWLMAPAISTHHVLATGFSPSAAARRRR